MGKKDKKKNNSTKYGETVPSEFGWVAPEKQKENADKMDKMTKKKK